MLPYIQEHFGHPSNSHTLGRTTKLAVEKAREQLVFDFLTIAGHKLYTPKGIGALYIRINITIEPLIHGAGHESGRRAGIENVIFDVALGKVCEIAKEKSKEGNGKFQTTSKVSASPGTSIPSKNSHQSIPRFLPLETFG